MKTTTGEDQRTGEKTMVEELWCRVLETRSTRRKGSHSGWQHPLDFQGPENEKRTSSRTVRTVRGASTASKVRPETAPIVPSQEHTPSRM